MLPSFPDTKRYRVVRPLGAGGMGAVYEVEDRTTGARLALKVMLAADPRRLLRFKQEFRVMAELHHPNLVRLFDLATEDDRWFFTMELVQGDDLVRVLSTAGDEPAPPPGSTAVARRAALEVGATVDLVSPADEVLGELAPPERSGVAPADAPVGKPGPACDPELLRGVIAQLLDALEFLHGSGVVHRDLKPSNVLIDVDGRVRVLDFGLASRVDRPDAISQEGVVVGTIAYLSPEQLGGGAATPASDLYALGVMLFQLLTGALPFAGGLAGAIMARLEAPPRVDERVDGVPPALVEVVHRLMAIEPAARATIDDVRAALGLARGARATPSGDRIAAAAASSDGFVGRVAELALLDACVARARDGTPQLALVIGGSGLGKSALADEVIRRAAPRGVLAFRGRSYEREQVPFVAFDRVMDAVTLSLQRWPAERLAPLRGALRAAARIFPALALLDARRDVRDDDAPDDDPLAQRRRAFDGVARLFAHLQAEAPLVLVLDDLQWADDESLALLELVLRGAGGGRLVVLGLARRDHDAAGLALDGLVHRLGGAAVEVTRLALAPLDSGDAIAIVEQVGGGRFDPATARALADHAGGNPFLVRRLAEHLAGLPADGRAAILDASGSTDDVLREMLRALSPRAAQVIALAAVAGGDVPATLLRDASGLPGADFDLAAGELLAGRFLKAVPGGPALPGRARGVADDAPRVDLYHDRIREVVYRNLTDDRRRALHRGLALTLQAVATADGHDAEALARHWGEAGDRVRRRRFAGEAAALAAAKLAFGRAARLLRVVADDPDPDEARATAAARWEQIGELHELSGDLRRAGDAFAEALAIWDALPDGARGDGAAPDDADVRIARLRLLGRAGFAYAGCGEIVRARALSTRGLAMLGLPFDRSLPARGLVLLRLGAQERLAGAGAAASSDPWLAARARFFDLMTRAFQPVWPLVAAEAALRSAILGRRAADHVARVRALAFTAVAPVFQRRCSAAALARAGRLLDASDAVARAHDVPLGAEIVQLNRALWWLPIDPARARRSSERALAALDRAGMMDSFDGNRARAQHLIILRVQGDLDAVLAAAARDLDPSRTELNLVNASLALASVAYVHAVRGDLARAGDAAATLRARTAGLPPTMLTDLVLNADAHVDLAAGRFAEVLAAADDGERAMRARGAWLLGTVRAPWLATMLDAAIGLARAGRLDAAARGRALGRARWMSARGVFDAGCLGDRARALLDHAAGRAGPARRALDRALVRSAVGASPYHRWLCLEAARELGALDRDAAAEADELAARGGFAMPPGWRSVDRGAP